MTINDLLSTPYYRGNQTLLAKEMNINRNTLRKYMTDIPGELHLVKKMDGAYSLFTKLNVKNKAKECK